MGEKDEMPVRARAKAFRQHLTDPSDEKLCCMSDKKVSLLAKATVMMIGYCSDQVMVKCLFSDQWSDDEVVHFMKHRGIDPRLMIKCRLAARRCSEGWEMPFPIDWENGHLSLWGHENYRISKPGACLRTRSWSGTMSIGTFLDLGVFRWHLPRIQREGHNLNGHFASDRPDCRTTFQVGFSKKARTSRDLILKKGYVADHLRHISMRLTVDANVSISSHEKASFWRQRSTFDEVVLFCRDITDGKIIMPTYLLLPIRKHVSELYNRFVVPEADEQRLRLMLALNIHGSEHITKDLHPLLADFLLPPPSNPFDRSAHLLLLEAP